MLSLCIRKDFTEQVGWKSEYRLQCLRGIELRENIPPRAEVVSGDESENRMRHDGDGVRFYLVGP